MDHDDFLDGALHIVDNELSVQALDKIGKDALQKQATMVLTGDVLSEAAQRRHIMEKMRFEGMKAMLELILKELDSLGKTRT